MSWAARSNIREAPSWRLEIERSTASRSVPADFPGGLRSSVGKNPAEEPSSRSSGFGNAKRRPPPPQFQSGPLIASAPCLRLLVPQPGRLHSRAGSPRSGAVLLLLGPRRSRSCSVRRRQRSADHPRRDPARTFLGKNLVLRERIEFTFPKCVCVISMGYDSARTAFVIL